MHETEFIAPRTRCAKPVYLLGYLFQREDWHELGLNLDASLRKLQLGGERGYGWGRLDLCHKVPLQENDRCFQAFKFDKDLKADRPVLSVTSEDVKLLAHTFANDNGTAAEIEPLLGRLTDKDGRFGQVPSEAKICWKPGSPVAFTNKFLVAHKGLWKALPTL